MNAADMAKSIVEVGTAWAKARGLSADIGISAMTQAVASMEIEMFEEHGKIWWGLKGARLKNPVNELPI